MHKLTREDKTKSLFERLEVIIRGCLNYRLVKWLLAVGLLATVLVFTACEGGTAPPTDTTPVTFPDANLEAAIGEALGKSPGKEITAEELTKLTKLDVSIRGIADLTGIEHLVNLTELELGGNEIDNLSPLANLTNLTFLGLSQTLTSDLSPLANLISLTELRLYSNPISDLSPLANLTNLTELRLYSNLVSDISPLANLTNLTKLSLIENQISNISPLSNLTSLTELWLSSNQISDISPLVANSGLSAGDTVDLRGNPLSVTSVNVYIPQLETRGVTVIY